MAGIVAPAVTAAASVDTTHESGLTEKIPETTGQNIASSGTSVYDQDTDETIVTITDAEMRQLLIDQGVSPSELGMYGLVRSNGVTKIIWHGKARNGNVDLYLSRNTMVMYHALSGAAGLVGVIVEAYFAQYSAAARQFAKAIAQTIAAGNTTNGKVFTARHWTSISIHNQ